MTLDQGYIQVYTGNGKGKTTAAIGQAIRALGNGLKVHFVQFMKNYPYGELKVLENIHPNFTIKRYGTDDFVFKKMPPDEKLIAEMRNGLKDVEKMMLSGSRDIIILDEILVSVYFKIFNVQEIISFLKKKPKKVEIILTGRYCPEQIIRLADLITDMKEVKHYYQKGVSARTGIES